MKPKRFFAYASAVILIGAGAIYYIINDYYNRQEIKNRRPELVMYKSPTCDCCTKWGQYMEHHGFKVTVKPTPQMAAVKVEKNIPYTLAACHTAVVDGYVVEGHVPVQDVRRLLTERPDAIGIAVPGMPQGSPGMITGEEEPYKVFLFKEDGSTKVYATHNQ